VFDDDIIKLLVDAGVGVFGTTIFQSSNAKIPTGSGPFISVINYGGGPPQVMQQSERTPAYEFPTCMIFARGTSHAQTRQMAYAAYQVLTQAPGGGPRVNFTINNCWYVSMSARQQPFDMGPDETGRLKYGFNMSAQKRPST
jgi:Bacteriophage minor capsid protein